MGLHARLMSQALRKINRNDSQNQLYGIFINQLRDKIGVMFEILKPLQEEMP